MTINNLHCSDEEAQTNTCVHMITTSCCCSSGCSANPPWGLGFASSPLRSHSSDMSRNGMAMRIALPGIFFHVERDAHGASASVDFFGHFGC